MKRTGIGFGKDWNGSEEIQNSHCGEESGKQEPTTETGTGTEKLKGIVLKEVLKQEPELRNWKESDWRGIQKNVNSSGRPLEEITIQELAEYSRQDINKMESKSGYNLLMGESRDEWDRWNMVATPFAKKKGFWWVMIARPASLVDGTVLEGEDYLVPDVNAAMVQADAQQTKAYKSDM